MFGLITTAAILIGAFFAFLYIASRNADHLFEDEGYECKYTEGEELEQQD